MSLWKGANVSLFPRAWVVRNRENESRAEPTERKWNEAGAQTNNRGQVFERDLLNFNFDPGRCRHGERVRWFGSGEEDALGTGSKVATTTE